MTQIRIEHDTHYTYERDVVLAQHLAYLRPRQDTWQRVLSSTLVVSPTADDLKEEKDAFGNARTFFALTKPHRELLVKTYHLVEKRQRYAGFMPSATPAWDGLRAEMTYSLEQPFVSASEFVWQSPYVGWLPQLKDYALPTFKKGRPIGEAVMELCERIHTDFEYCAGATEIHTPLAVAFSSRKGVCQDFSHIMIGCLRAVGLAARYVSGYLLTTPPPGEPKLRGADASHAWVSVYCPGAMGDWLEIDPTNRAIADTSHVVLAFGRDFGDVSPLRGVIRGGGEHALRIAVTAEPLTEPAV